MKALLHFILGVVFLPLWILLAIVGLCSLISFGIPLLIVLALPALMICAVFITCMIGFMAVGWIIALGFGLFALPLAVWGLWSLCTGTPLNDL